MGFVDNDHRAVNRTVGVVTPLQFFIVLSVQFIPPTLFWSNTVIYCVGGIKIFTTSLKKIIFCVQRDTIRLPTSIPGLSVRVPVGFILSPVIVICPGSIVSVILVSAVLRWKKENRQLEAFNEAFFCVGHQQSPVSRFTSQVLVSALRAAVAILVVAGMSAEPGLSSRVPPFVAFPRFSPVTPVGR